MKKLLTALILSVSLLTTPAVVTGCKSPPQTIAYNTLFSTLTAVNAAENSYVDLRVTGVIDGSKDLEVMELSRKFHTAMADAIEIAQNNLDVKTPTDVANLAVELIALIRKASQ